MKPKTMKPKSPSPKNKIKGTQMIQYTMRLNWKFTMFLPCVSIWYTLSFCVSHKIKGTIKLPNPMTKVTSWLRWVMTKSWLSSFICSCLALSVAFVFDRCGSLLIAPRWRCLSRSDYTKFWFLSVGDVAIPQATSCLLRFACWSMVDFYIYVLIICRDARAPLL